MAVNSDNERICILLVDDEVSYLQNLHDFLELKGCYVVKASTSQQALEIARHPNSYFHAALIDYTIEGDLDCVQLIKGLRESQPQMDSVILTAFEESDMVEAMQAGAYRSFEKRIGADAIFNVLQILVANQREKASQSMLEQANQISGIMLDLSEQLATLRAETIFQAACDALCKLFRDVDIEIIRLEKRSWTMHYETVLQNGKLLPKRKRTLYPEGKTDLAIAWVLQRQSTYTFSNYPQDNTPQDGYPGGLLLESVIGETPKSWMGVPLVANQVALGAICISSSEANRFSSSDRWVVMTIAQHVGQALYNMLLYQEMEIIDSISRAIATKKRQSELLDLVVEQISQLFDIQNLRIGLYNKWRDQTDIIIRYENGKRIEPLSLSMYSGLTSYTIRTGLSVIGNSREEIEKFEKRENIEPVGRPALSWLSAPLVGPDRKPVGAIALQDYLRENAYNQHDLQLLERIAAHLAVAVASAQLFNQVEIGMSQRKTLSELTDRMQRGSTTFPENWKWDFLTGVTAGYGLGFNRALLFQWEPESGNDPACGRLVGLAAIGDLTQGDAEATWARMARENVDSIEGYEVQPSSEITNTPANRALEGMVLTISSQSDDVFSRIIFHRNPSPQVASAKSFSKDAPLINTFTLREFAVVPIFHETRLRYILIADNLFTHQPITQESLEQLRSFASTVMTIVEKYGITEQLRHRIDTLNQLYEISQRIAAAKSSEDVLQYIVEETRKLLDADCVVLYPYRAETNSYDVPNIKKTGLLNPLIVKNKKRTEHSSSEKIRQSKQIIVDNVDSGWDNSRLIRIFPKKNGFRDREKIKSYAAILLSAKGQDEGMLFVSYRKLHVFTEKELDLIQSIGNLTAVTIAKNRLDRQKDALLTSQLIMQQGISYIQQLVVKAKPKDSRVWKEILKESFRHSLATRGWVIKVNNNEGYLECLATFSKTGKELEILHRDLIEELCKTRVNHINNIRFSERWKKLFPDKTDVCSFLSVKTHIYNSRNNYEKILIYLESDQANAFDDDTRDLVKGLAKATALVSKQAHLFKDIARRSHSLNGQFQALQAVSRETQLNVILNVIVERAVWLSTVDGKQADVGILYRKRGDYLEVECKNESAKPLLINLEPICILQSKEPINERTMNICEWVALHRKVHKLPGGKDQPGPSPSIGMGSEIAAPLQGEEGELLGILYLGHSSPNGLSPEDMRNIETFATTAEIAIQMAVKRDALATNQFLNYMNSLGSFLYHDIASPVNAIHKISSELGKIFQGDDYETNPVDLVSKLKQATDEVLRQYDGLRGTETCVRVVDLLQERREKWMRSYNDKQIEWNNILVDVGAETAFIKVNRIVMEHVLDNVINNAVQAMEESSTRIVEIHTYEGKSGICIDISDTGKGIDQEKLHKLYWYVMNESNQPHQKGFGAALAGQVVRGMGGYIRPSNNSFGGAIIQIWLPIEENHE